MTILTPAAVADFDNLAKLAGNTQTNPLQAEIKVWHCGGIKSKSDLLPGEGLWVFSDVAKSRYYEGSSVNNYKKSKEPGYKEAPQPYPYYLEMILGPKGLNCVDFAKQSMQALTAAHFNRQHDLMKKGLIEWAKMRKFDLILNTNGGGGEVVVVYPEKHLTFIACQDLITGKWGKRIVKTQDATDPSP